LRTGKLIYPKENKILAKELFLEAAFYQIRGIQKVIYLENPLQNSSFIINSLNDEQKKVLLSWLPQQENFLNNWVQLYSAQANSWSTTTFHQLCDNKGPTLIIARASNYIFGGYAEISWDSGKPIKVQNTALGAEHLIFEGGGGWKIQFMQELFSTQAKRPDIFSHKSAARDIRFESFAMYSAAGYILLLMITTLVRGSDGSSMVILKNCLPQKPY
jgi:hypothetical protein